MGRRLLIGCTLVAAFGCGQAEQSKGSARADSTVAPTTAHAALSCAACHQGARADGEQGAVPRAACTTSGCHDDAGPAEVTLVATRFQHRNHGLNGAVEPTCAGCHTHGVGQTKLKGTVDACAVCHRAELTGDNSRKCRTCHQEAQHVTLTTQGVPVPHASLPWLETGCVRCHYDVAAPKIQVATRRCRSCHNALDQVTAQGIATNLHPKHAGLSCISCHEADAHRVRKLSSAVALQCSDCHSLAHAQALVDADYDPTTCNACHTTVHEAQQRLLLGLLPDGAATPSTKFLAGITCRSCHTPPTRARQLAVRGQSEACASCHSQEYGTVLAWWLDGTRERTRLTADFAEQARRDLAAGPDSARALVENARAMVGLVREAGGQHNLELSDRLLRESIRRVLAAYERAGRKAPIPPELGSPVHYGLCSYCHYSANDPWNYDRMPQALHKQFMKSD